MTHLFRQSRRLTLLVVLLFTAHLGAALFFTSRHTGPAMLLGGGALLIVLIHFGAVGSLLGRFRRREGPGSSPPPPQ